MLKQQQSIDGVHYDKKSHSMYFTSKNLPQVHETSFHQRWFDTPKTHQEKVNRLYWIFNSSFNWLQILHLCF